MARYDAPQSWPNSSRARRSRCDHKVRLIHVDASNFSMCSIYCDAHQRERQRSQRVSLRFVKSKHQHVPYVPLHTVLCLDECFSAKVPVEQFVFRRCLGVIWIAAKLHVGARRITVAICFLCGELSRCESQSARQVADLGIRSC